MQRIICLISFITILSISSFSQTVVWQDLMNGDNSIAGLQSRGWIILNVDGGGSTDPFFQGNPTVFTAFEGPDSGYVGSNYAGANSQAIIDQWLVSPSFQVLAGDSLVFYARSASSTAFTDSIYILLSDNAGTTTQDFTNEGGFRLSTSQWQSYWLRFLTSGTKRFAIAYFVSDSSRADYIGLDNFKLYRKGTVNYSSTINLSQSFTFSDASKQSSYKMIGIPGQTNISISQFMSGSNNSDWKAFYDNGASSNYLIEYNGTSQFNLGQGKGFWILSKSQINISGQASAATLVNGNNFNLSVHSGWNIITNPFDKDVDWSLVQSNNALPENAVLYSWNGSSWSQTSTFSAYNGYYFNNIYNLTSINIPYDFTNSGIGKAITNDQDSKILKLSLLQNNNVENASIEIGINKNAKTGLDKYDLFAPPGDFDNSRIEINEENLKTNYKELFADFRPALNDEQIYELKVKNINGGNLSFTVEGIDNFTGYEIYLINDELNSYYDLRKNNTVTINSFSENYILKLVIAKKDSMEHIANNLTPKFYNLDQNYPNPFNPTTVIRYSVPAGVVNSNASIRVMLKVYDILGNEITTLVNGEKQPGTYEVRFDGSKLASGIYFYRLNAGDFSQTKKMILLK
jgi:Secretion system C-terminal sorting domain